MTGTKLVKVDNWGIFFLQRLKHFFNRTDYCDLTLQFQDNAQLKVHRLVLSACTEYFELLERTCEMYEDCLVMPDDLQADVVVPIVNFMYTGQLEFKPELLDKLYQTSEIMNMPVLTKLLESHRNIQKSKPDQLYTPKKVSRQVEAPKEEPLPGAVVVTSTPAGKRSYSKAFEKQKAYVPSKPETSHTYHESSPAPVEQRYLKKNVLVDPRPTRYELPEELDTDNIFESSFTNISYTSQPLMVHPETRKQYFKRPKIDATLSKKYVSSTVDIVQCPKDRKSQEDNLFGDTDKIMDESDFFQTSLLSSRIESPKDSSQLFDQILDQEEKVPIEKTKPKSAANLDHAKIISEVLKKYPHLVKSNKNIKLKILNTPSKTLKKQKVMSPVPEKAIKTERQATADYTFETDVIDSKQAAKLIALGAENVDGPWICLICGTPGKAMNFISYYKFRRHLVEVHNEKPVLNICEHCGLKSAKRNYLIHHLYTRHGIDPPSNYHFPKCNHCNYIALTEALLVKHKSSHTDNKNFRCNVCPAAFNTSNQLLGHIQNTGHKYSAEKRTNIQCIYCFKGFLREINLYAHLKAYHRSEAVRDGIIDDSEDEGTESKAVVKSVKSEPVAHDFEEVDVQYQIQQKPDGNIHVITKRQKETTPTSKQKILNAQYTTTPVKKLNTPRKVVPQQSETVIGDLNMPIVGDEIVVIDDNEYIVRDNQLIPRKLNQVSEEFILSDDPMEHIQPSTSMAYASIPTSNCQENLDQASLILKDSGTIPKPIPIYVSNEEEYKALMASDQPIIFDSGDASKTLTVLENTSIDLNNAQPNDMMIIQDLPLNVTQEVSTDNSNIVVVYSHDVGNQSKQYQLITTQGLEAQFVQSSSILTQNYETVTTAAPLMQARVIDKETQQVWQNNLHPNVANEPLQITPINEIQTIVNEEPIVITESNNDLYALPEDKLQPEPKDTELHANDEAVTQSNTENAYINPLTIQTSEAEITNNLHDTEELNEEPLIDTLDASMTEEKAIETPLLTEVVLDNTEITESTLNLENNGVIELKPDEDNVENINQIDEQFEAPNLPTEISEISENIESIQTNPDQEGTLPESISEESTASPSEHASVASVAEHVNDTNQTLGTNWAGEQTDTELVETVIETEVNEIKNELDDISIHQAHEIVSATNGASAPDTATHDQNNDPDTEIEESIENIQHEVEKQMSLPISMEHENGIDQSIGPSQTSAPRAASAEPDHVTNHSDSGEVSTAPAAVSSLLTDWDDNDSQADNDSTNDEIPEESEVSTIDDTNVSVPDTIESVETDTKSDKNDKIKSLVSDWDEDEEENAA